MFCKNCGTQLKDDATFCSECGSSVKAPSAGPDQEVPNNTAPQSTPPKASNGFMKAIEGLTMLHLYAIAAAAVVLNLIFYFFGTIKVSVSILGYSDSETGGLWATLSDDGKVFVNVISLILFIAAIAFVAASIYFKWINNKCYMIFPIAAMAWSVLWLIIECVSLASEAEAAMFGSAASIAPGFGGWLMIISAIVGIAASVLVILRTKNAPKTDYASSFKSISGK